MSLLFNRSTSLSNTLTALGFPLRSASSKPVVNVNADTALRHSAVWACLRLRADLVSTTPLDVFRRINGVQIELTKPPLLTVPGGKRVGIEEWLYSTQMDLDRFGNAFGVITLRDGLGFPQRIDLVPAQDVTVVVKDGGLSHYKIAGVEYAPEDIWHERQFTVPGLFVGLSPVTYAAWSIGSYLSAQEFALDWFTSGAAPTGHLRNTLVPTVPEKEAGVVKERFKSAVQGRDIFVTGRDWEYTMAAVPANTTMFLEEMQYGVADVCRFFGVPGDLIGAETSTGSITYASVTQRNLQLLVMNLGPVFVRREKALSAAIPSDRYVKFATDALLRMDPEARTRDMTMKVQSRIMAPSEARELDNRPPFDDTHYAEFDRLFGNPNPPAPAPVQKQLEAPSITVDARTFVEPNPVSVNLEAPATPDVHVHNAYEIDARSTVDAGAIVANVDARSDVTVPERAVTVTVPEPATPAPMRKRVETDEKGRIIAVIEERA